MAKQKLSKTCRVCGKRPARAAYTYCSNSCQQEFQYQAYLKRWKDGKEKGLSSIGTVSNPIKRYLREKYQNKCSLCGWSRINPTTKVVPLVADHVDGNWRHNEEKNLRLICPNCDALSSTYAGANKGNGRGSRAPSKRREEARVLARGINS